MTRNTLLLLPVTGEGWGESPKLATVEVGASVAAELLRRLDDYERIHARDPDINQMLYNTSRVRWLDIDLPDLSDDFRPYAERVLEGESIAFHPDELPDDVPVSESIHYSYLKVFGDTLVWEGEAKHADLSFETEWVNRRTVVRALLLATPDADLAQMIGRFIEPHPDLIVDLLERGFSLESEKAAPRPLPPLPRHVLLPLLEHEDGEIRQRAITVLGRTRRDTGPGRSR